MGFNEHIFVLGCVNTLESLKMQNPVYIITNIHEKLNIYTGKKPKTQKCTCAHCRVKQ